MAGLAASGCSALFQDALTTGWSPRRGTPPDCSEGVALPAIDIVFGVLDTVGAVYSEGTTSLLSAVFGALWLGSAIGGFNAASNCSNAWQRWNDSPTSRARIYPRDDAGLTDEQQEEIDEVKRARIREQERDKLELERLRREERQRLRDAERQPPADAGVDATTTTDAEEPK